MIAIILVGGKISISPNIAGETLLYWQAKWLKAQGFTHLVYAAHANATHISSEVQQLASLLPELCLDVVIEPRPLGTAGAAARCARRFPSSLICIINGNNLFFSSLVEPLQALQEPTLDGVILATKAPHGSNATVLIGDHHQQLIKCVDNVTQDYELISSGVYLLRGELLQMINTHQESSLEKEWLSKWVAQGKRFKLICDLQAPLIDLDNPQSMAEANGVIQAQQSSLLA